MCLQAQGIDDNYDIVDILRQARGLSDDNGGIGRGRGIHDTSEILETTNEASRIHGQQRRLWRRDHKTEELATMEEASEKEDYPKVLTTRMEASAEEAEEPTRRSERLHRRRRRCVYGLRVLKTTASALED